MEITTYQLEQKKFIMKLKFCTLYGVYNSIQRKKQLLR